MENKGYADVCGANKEYYGECGIGEYDRGIASKGCQYQPPYTPPCF